MQTGDGLEAYFRYPDRVNSSPADNSVFFSSKILLNFAELPAGRRVGGNKHFRKKKAFLLYPESEIANFFIVRRIKQPKDAHVIFSTFRTSQVWRVCVYGMAWGRLFITYMAFGDAEIR